MSNSYDYKLDLESKNSLSVIISKIRPQSCILEFGPANGRMTRYLKEALGCKIYGVEIDSEAASVSGIFMEQLIVEDIGTLGWLKTFGNITFDAIIFADVLEHLSDPLNILTHAATLLGLDGTIYVSIPNITHNCVIMELFKEQFTYRNAGLLDSTHIRFFSHNSFKDLVKQSSLSIVFEDTIVVPPELSEFTHTYEEFFPFVSDFLEKREYGEVYQFIFGLKRHTTHEEMTYSLVDKKPKRYAQLLVDCGEGYGEHIQSIFIENQDLKISLEFDISHYENIIGLRFDPLNRCAIIKLHEVIVFYKNGESTILEHSVSNAKISHKGRDYFTTYDPIYHLDLINKEIIHGKTLKIIMSYQEDSCQNILEKIIIAQEEVINKLNLLWTVKLSSKLSRFLNFILNRSSNQ